MNRYIVLIENEFKQLGFYMIYECRSNEQAVQTVTTRAPQGFKILGVTSFPGTDIPDYRPGYIFREVTSQPVVKATALYNQHGN